MNGEFTRQFLFIIKSSYLPGSLVALSLKMVRIMLNETILCKTNPIKSNFCLPFCCCCLPEYLILLVAKKTMNIKKVRPEKNTSTVRHENQLLSSPSAMQTSSTKQGVYNTKSSIVYSKLKCNMNTNEMKMRPFISSHVGSR